MPVFRGDWWAQKERPILKSIREIDSEDLASCSVTTAKLADGSVESTKLADTSVDTSKIADLNVTSEKASTNLLTRSLIALVAESASSDGGVTSSYQLWRPLVPVTILRIQHIALTAYENATGDIFTIFGGASSVGSSMASVDFAPVSTGIVAGTRTAASTLDVAGLAACTDLKIKLVSTTCSNPGQSAFQIDYVTTG